MILTYRRPGPPDTHAMTMVNNVIEVLNYVIAARPQPLNSVIADSWMLSCVRGRDWLAPLLSSLRSGRTQSGPAAGARLRVGSGFTDYRGIGRPPALTCGHARTGASKRHALMPR
jgi:hypothetical protein